LHLLEIQGSQEMALWS